MEKIKFVRLERDEIKQKATVHYFNGKDRYYNGTFPVTVAKFIFSAKYCKTSKYTSTDFYFNNPDVLPHVVLNCFR